MFAGSRLLLPVSTNCVTGTFGPSNIKRNTRTTHTCWYWWFMGTLCRRNGFYTLQTVFSLILHLNLYPSQQTFWIFLFKKNHHVARQCPHKPPLHCNTSVRPVMQICVLVNHPNQCMRTHRTYIIQKTTEVIIWDKSGTEHLLYLTNLDIKSNHLKNTY